MKKTKMRRLFASAIACVVGVATMAAGAVSASATELPGPQPIVALKLKGKKEAIGGHKFRALKLADYVGVNSAEGKYGVSTIRDNADLKAAIVSAAKATAAPGKTVNEADPMAWLATQWGLASDKGKELTGQYTGEVRDFVTELLNTKVPPDGQNAVTLDKVIKSELDTDPKTIQVVGGDQATDVTFNIPNGIYLILDVTTTADGVDTSNVEKKPESIPMLVSTEVKGIPGSGSSEINVKAPDIKTDKKVEQTSYNIGDYVHYTISSEIPIYTGYTGAPDSFHFWIVDILSPSLTYYPDASKFTVKVGGVPLQEGPGADYLLKAYKPSSPTSSTPASPAASASSASQASNSNKSASCSAQQGDTEPNEPKICGDDVSPTSTDFTGDPIKQATLVFDLSKYINNKIAQKDWSAGGKTVTIDYSVVLNEDAELDGNGNKNTVYSMYGTGDCCNWVRTPRNHVYFFSGSIKVDKISNDIGAQLGGVKFQVYKGDTEQGNALLFVKDTGKSNGTTDYYHEPLLGGKTGVDNIVTSDGKSFVINGLADGKYTFVERETPKGYMIPAGFKFTVEVKHTVPDKDNHPDQAKYTYTVTGDDYGLVTTPGAVDNNSNKLHVLNIKSLTELPATGMVGIVMRVVLGALLIAIALALYFGIRHVQRSRAQGTMAR
ncbi:SpaA isopeptide-forming pilin-related protein [Bifidobacterium sp. ESL0704]|uniref:SpaA isopeptide-forming pilin-related protein n=1 Tax=Bifidobacterium sp. ESL0704 TaxID=2983219 RepID=UPI0023FA1C1B|nr:SpaA isopeptide-forming pilin-related protein [Bifidobacterium sp. ESL0704]WEV52858.1 SpaA isopeptide-forming pilin-related protein [Bifidobacterium sp. ESL0704]